MIYYTQGNHTILNGDILDELSSLENESVDLIFADPPYNIGKDYGNNIDKKPKQEYIKWCKSWIDEAMRVLKYDGTMYLMCSTQYMPYLDVYIQDNYHIIQHIVWCYDSSGIQAKKYYGSLYEPILMITHNKKSKYTFNKDDILIEAKTGSRRKLIDYRCNPPRPYNTHKVPGNVWNFNRVRYKMKEYTPHPTQKPLKLLERIVLASSNEKDTVLDLFGGSGTTSEVCKKLNRKSITIELNKDYCRIIKDRITQ